MKEEAARLNGEAPLLPNLSLINLLGPVLIPVVTLLLLCFGRGVARNLSTSRTNSVRAVADENASHLTDADRNFINAENLDADADPLELAYRLRAEVIRLQDQLQRNERDQIRAQGIRTSQASLTEMIRRHGNDQSV